MKVSQVRGLEESSRLQVWANMAQTRDRLTTLIVERFVGGMSQHDMEAALEKAPQAMRAFQQRDEYPD